jgi:hypothetical protein
MQITTTAPISLDNLKKYYEDKTTSYLIDYKNSTLKEQKLLTYLSNLDLNCDILIDNVDEDFFTLLKTYFNTTSLVKIRFLELSAIDVLFEYKKLINGNRYTQFIEDNKDIVEQWVTKLESLAVFNTYTINDEAAKNEALSFPNDDTDTVEGINWVRLVTNAEFFKFYNSIDQTKLKFYTKYFTEYMFKGQNLYSFWANENNPMFILTWGIMNQQVTPENFKQVIEQSRKELENVALS